MNTKNGILDADKAKIAGQKLLAAFEDGDLQEMGYCQYTDNSGKHCAVGYLMPPEILRQIQSKEGTAPYETSRNNEPFSDLPWEIQLQMEKLTGVSHRNLRNLQIIFDAQDPPSFFGYSDYNTLFTDMVKSAFGLETVPLPTDRLVQG